MASLDSSVSRPPVPASQARPPAKCRAASSRTRVLLAIWASVSPAKKSPPEIR
jgi:hypothetical protein